MIAIYVYDILLAGKIMKRMNTVKQALSQKFQVKDMGELNYFLGVKVVQDHNAGSVWIGQQSYTESILRKFGMQDAKKIQTPGHLSIATRPGITYAVSMWLSFVQNQQNNIG